MTDVAATYHSLSVGDKAGANPDSIRGPVWVGVLIIAAFFGVFGGWAAVAPLNGAVLADAVVKVEGNRKSVQHFDGGTVKQIRVKDGDVVKSGDVLVLLDDTRARAEFNLYSQQYALLRATDSRIRAELDGSEAVAFPKDITAEHQAYLQDAMASQIADLESQRAQMAGARQILQKRIAELEEQIEGKQARVESFRAQLKSTVDEKAGLNKLLKAGLTTKPRILELDRSASDLQGLIDQALGEIAGNRQSKAELESQIAQLTNERRAKLSAMLIETQANLADLVPKMFAAQAMMNRAEVRAPYDGQVMDLTVFSTGAIVAPGQTILDIVPTRNSLIVQAQVRVEDISSLRADMTAEIRFTSYKQRTTPVIHGQVTHISADRVTDAKTGFPYYVADVAVDADELAAAPQIQLYPGMPASVMIVTEERTALDYILGPLTASLHTAFRQK
ncbi:MULTISPECIES: HlyD family type I secretion periplasmic adaptor subunit [unclassified Mesorhizobium]|uniref:HlyD family type I secretion periplasmic adaptor subunit n=1 Tax=unclassified Mesorhizobium TaxID=325217 RepID=UPI000BB07E7C|nr:MULTISPECIES: HlyD family type I secretion periplasmic adaptor subunit [unclassified Mesorhizobium]TGT53580.1 HlyD family type I secretion periplasmic adaptor subunit [Mesorhizobium sp. M00.F.Ca.ET.170.01.1.1]AZO08484.1 HlyD family type I secretion periplasmic adaptor subunit [Mesorhizobium sp. M3A.F.Ca.ET.080.04.2.1]PBB83891.1 secretion protein HylD [Mesorhizobium sp. WSM3876]RWB67749.1 MAG: HlyD family type I secretion periplasmic adaptor subunit [Mesorhizobium sp.]RWB82316.1 MAG: HlyD fa